MPSTKSTDWETSSLDLFHQHCLLFYTPFAIISCSECLVTLNHDITTILQRKKMWLELAKSLSEIHDEDRHLNIILKRKNLSPEVISKSYFCSPKVFPRIYKHSPPWVLAKGVLVIFHFLSKVQSVYPPKVALSKHQRNW